MLLPRQLTFFPPGQEGLNPTIMNPPQVLVRTCLTKLIYTQEKEISVSGQAEGISPFSTSSQVPLWIQNYPSPQKASLKYSAAKCSF